jgi:hypothetical protein
LRGKNGHKTLETYSVQHPIVVFGVSKLKQQRHIYYVAGEVVSNGPFQDIYLQFETSTKPV